MNVRHALAAILLATALLPASATAQRFEGVVRQRTIEVDEQGLFDVLYDENVEEPDFDSEEAWLRYTADRLFAIPPERWIGGEDAMTEEATLHVKGDRIRSDISGPEGKMTFILNGATGQVWIVNHAGRFYITYSMEEMEAATERMLEEMGIDPEEAREMDALMNQDGSGPLTVRATGESRDLNGFRAAEYEASGVGRYARGWCATDDAGLRRAMEGLMGGLSMMEDEDEDSPGGGDLATEVCGERVPVQVQAFTSGYSNSYRFEEILGLEQTAVSDDLFRVPEGYAQRRLEDIWR
ncbi:MAG TPA: hypothetical protein VLA43_20105 [Longimicrobiales bacterium]|nr:hypothetical protein [Longimicrobiales bacterium]